jgi:hypothetical protein
MSVRTESGGGGEGGGKEGKRKERKRTEYYDGDVDGA